MSGASLYSKHSIKGSQSTGDKPGKFYHIIWSYFPKHLRKGVSRDKTNLHLAFALQMTQILYRLMAVKKKANKKNQPRTSQHCVHAGYLIGTCRSVFTSSKQPKGKCVFVGYMKVIFSKVCIKSAISSFLSSHTVVQHLFPPNCPFHSTSLVPIDATLISI